jgi:tRNA pseudouridine13 synthase
MYVHAYQSYVWNAIVSERVRLYGADSPIPGDLVYEGGKTGHADMDVDSSDEIVVLDENDVRGPGAHLSSIHHYPNDVILSSLTEENSAVETGKKSKKTWVAPQVKTLTEEDVDQYTIFDVIMPLPGKDVAYPGGAMGDRYKDFLHLDGLDPDNFVRKQR